MVGVLMCCRLVIVAGSLGFCTCTDCTVGASDLSKCEQTKFGRGCGDLSSCSSNGAAGYQYDGQSSGAYSAEVIFGIGFIVAGTVFSCGYCLNCCFGKTITTTQVTVQTAQAIVPPPQAQVVTAPPVYEEDNPNPNVPIAPVPPIAPVCTQHADDDLSKT
eukprot:TRINITY_DN7877_c0_g1_i2.p2 TRINITY_DN7877_c0_g1~~TRINITY_DN7877_c0_g1_i2.p2  ORF type:complete len:160 (-),score=26.15 TRINITY_DN7877_c0_g1_i2:210-689(-)